jgi:hypothetical protein
MVFLYKKEYDFADYYENNYGITNTNFIMRSN